MDTLPTSPRSRSVSPRREYREHERADELSQAMLNYLDIEGLLELYKHTPGAFNTSTFLNLLSHRFDLPLARSFQELLKMYDMKYATVRSYIYHNAKEVFIQAASEGNMLAVIHGLDRYPKKTKKNTCILYKALIQAASGGHEEIVLLLLDLINNKQEKYGYVIIGAAKGCQVELLKKYYTINPPANNWLDIAMRSAAKNGCIEIIEFLLQDPVVSTDPVRCVNSLMHSAGKSGDKKIVEYLISKGATRYITLVGGAAFKGHLDIVKQYYIKAGSPCLGILEEGIEGGRLNIVKFALKQGHFTQEELNSSLKLTDNQNEAIASYLRSKGAVFDFNDVDSSD